MSRYYQCDYASNFSASFTTTNFIKPAVGNWTYSAWIYPTLVPTSGGNFGGWIVALDTTNEGMWLIHSATGGGCTLAGQTLGTAKSGSSATSVDSAIVLNKWQYVTYVYTAATGKSQLFINGVEVQYASQTSNVASDSTAYQMGVGQQYPYTSGNGSTYGFAGYMDTVGVWLAALTPAEMVTASQYGGTLTVRPASLKGYWPLLGVQSPEPSFPGNLFPLTLGGNVLPTQAQNSPGQTAPEAIVPNIPEPPIVASIGLITPGWPMASCPAANPIAGSVGTSPTPNAVDAALINDALIQAGETASRVI